MFRRRINVLALLLLLSLSANVNADPTVGVYYYPWWGAGEGGHTFDQTLRAHTTPNDQLPAVGDEYSSRDANVISSHIDQSHLGNISMWSMSWWGPNSYENSTIRNNILPHPRADELSYTIHYEAGGRLGDHNSPNYTNLIPDFEYLADNIFNDDNYMKIDGRPVVVMYLSRVYFDDAAGTTAINDLRTAMQNQYGYDPYIIGDHLFNSVAANPSNMDAITDFDVYGQVFGDGVVNQSKIDQLEQIYASAQTVANNAGVDFVPGLAPGYNDKAVRPGHDPAARYFPGEAFGTAMEAMLEDAVLPHTDVDINDLILVNSFNEWHEDTQIEASVIGPSTNTDDTPSGMDLTVGRFYEGYGNKYLDILRNATQTTPPLTPAEIKWGRGTANGMFVGNYTDLANWNADDVLPDAPRVPESIDRARVDRGSTNMTLDSTIVANDFLFGVDEAGQTFTFEATADVTLNTNYFVAFNEGDITVDILEGATLSIGSSFLLGQYDGRSNGDQSMDDNDITVTIAGTVDVSGATILGNKYGFDGTGTPNPLTTSELVDVLLDVTSGTLRTSNITFAPNGDLATYLATNTSPGNENTMGVRIGNEGLIVITGSDATANMNNLISQGLLYTDSTIGSIKVTYDGADTLVQVMLDGDFNDDGYVNGKDFLVWQIDPSVGNLSDWENNYGYEPPAVFAAVPEPGALTLSFASALVLYGTGGRRRR
jgi:glycoprotein endo-alpha-1,2-mannosidase